VTAVWQEILNRRWLELGTYPAQNRQYRTLRLLPDLRLDAYAALRAADDAPCLVIEAQVQADDCFEASGLRLAPVRGERGPLTVLSLEDQDYLDLFTTVCADAVAAAASGAAPLEQFLARLGAWRRFLRERGKRLTREETIGILGELTILHRLMLCDENHLDTWQSPDDGLHDFLLGGHALEVKASLGVSPSLRISSLDQLDNSGLRRLDLIHVRLIEDPAGECLEQLIGRISVVALSEATRRKFGNALLRRGLTPDDTAARSDLRVRLHSIDAYQVRQDFPRLARGDVPLAVTEAMYALDLRSLSPFATGFDTTISLFSEGVSA
jgi:hypothetical protein